MSIICVFEWFCSYFVFFPSRLCRRINTPGDVYKALGLKRLSRDLRINANVNLWLRLMHVSDLLLCFISRDAEIKHVNFPLHDRVGDSSGNVMV